MSLSPLGNMPLAFLLVVLADGVMAETPFATRVVDYAPAPGQWVNDFRFNDPSAALGQPFPGGLPSPDESSLVSLGGFGGSITLAFDHTILDDPLNSFGMDAIVFSNAFWVAGNPNDHWAECATIEISLDVNRNGLADDRWYLIPGSHINDLWGQFTSVTWDSDVNDDTYPPPYTSWIPPGFSGVWTTSGYLLPLDVFGVPLVTNPSSDPAVEGIFGYAEYSPTLLLGDLDADNAVDDPNILPEEFYTVPDDPLAVGITPGSGGGDAFDIAWAIDPATGKSANLPGFDFIRITTAVNVVLGVIGEMSAEIDAVADAAPDPFGDFDDDGDIDLVDVAALQNCFGVADVLAAGCDRMDREPDGFIDLVDAAQMFQRLTGPR